MLRRSKPKLVVKRDYFSPNTNMTGVPRTEYLWSINICFNDVTENKRFRYKIYVSL